MKMHHESAAPAGNINTGKNDDEAVWAVTVQPSRTASSPSQNVNKRSVFSKFPHFPDRFFPALGSTTNLTCALKLQCQKCGKLNQTSIAADFKDSTRRQKQNNALTVACCDYEPLKLTPKYPKCSNPPWVKAGCSIY